MINLFRRKHKLVRYVNLLHKYGVGSRQADDFVRLYKDDSVFQRRAKVFNWLFAMKDKL